MVYGRDRKEEERKKVIESKMDELNVTFVDLSDQIDNLYKSRHCPFI